MNSNRIHFPALNPAQAAKIDGQARIAHDGISAVLESAAFFTEPQLRLRTVMHALTLSMADAIWKYTREANPEHDDSCPSNLPIAQGLVNRIEHGVVIELQRTINDAIRAGGLCTNDDDEPGDDGPVIDEVVELLMKALRGGR